MSSAFVKEGDNRWLHEIAPTIQALTNFLSQENGLRITEKKNFFDDKRKLQVHQMSDGFSYAVKENRWVCLD